MSQQDKLVAKILLGTSDSNTPFDQLCQLLRTLGFDERIRGSHHIFSKEGIEEILNLQPKQGKAFIVPSQTSSHRNFELSTRRTR